MPSAIVTLPDGRKARLSGPTREAVTRAAQRLAGQSRGVDPNTGAYDANLAVIDRMMSSAPPAEREQSRYPVSLGPLGEFRLPRAISGAANALANVEKETSIPLVAGTMGSLAAGPVLGAAAARTMIAPALSRLTPVARTALGAPAAFAVRAAAPTAGATAGGVLAGGALEADAGGSAGDIARAAARTGVGMGVAELAGLGIGSAVAKFWAPNLRFLDPLKGVRERLVDRATVSVRGRKAVDVGRLAAAWNRLPESKKKLIPRDVQTAVAATLERLSAFGAKVKKVAAGVAATPFGGEIVEAMIVPAATAMFGVGVGVPLMIGKALLNPGPAVRYLTRDKLPDEITRLAGRQAVTLEARRQVDGPP